MPEEFTLKFSGRDGPEWLRRNGDKVRLRSRKALRNYLRNQRFTIKVVAIYCNGEPFEFKHE